MEECHQMKAAIRVCMIVVPFWNHNIYFFTVENKLDELSSEFTSKEKSQHMT